MRGVSQLARKGILARDGFMSPYDVSAAKWANGDVIAFRGNFAGGFLNPEKVKDTVAYSLPPMKTYHFNFVNTPWMLSAITSKSKNVARATTFLEFCASKEGQLYFGFGGVEGKKGDKFSGDMANGPYYYVDPGLDATKEVFPSGKPVWYKELYEAASKDWGAVFKQTGIWRHSIMQNWNYNNWELNWWSGPNQKSLQYTDFMLPHVTFNTAFNMDTNLLDAAQRDEVNVAGSKVDKIRKDYELKLIFSASDAEFDALYGECMKKLDEAGLQTLEAGWTKIYQMNLAKAKK
jgi:hypothetical protein